MADLFWFSDEPQSQIEPFLPPNTLGLERVDNRRIIG
jgi:hypothetical protein